MNCQNHPDTPATAYCRSCGKAVCEQCRRDAYGTVFCEEHAPAFAPPADTPPPSPEPPRPRYQHSDVSPGLALGLGFIPGVGAIYNGQYAKGLVHAVIFGIIISILDTNLEGVSVIFSFVLTAWIFYMAFEAYHTARRRRNGEPVDEYSGLLSFQSRTSAAPVAGVILVLLGVVLLLDTLHLFDFAYLARYWPVLLIGAGAYLLYSRFSAAASKEIHR
ncbi:MAG: B-box zinc finger protein [Acidobacteriia bacterium]|nr:B-box zinc finger protein [Terriglobia bacterium]